MQIRRPHSKAQRNPARRFISVALMGFGPALLWVAIIWIDEMYAPRPRSLRIFWLMPLALIPGIVGILLQDLRKGVCVLAVPLYAVLTLPVLLVVELVVVCASYGRCL